MSKLERAWRLVREFIKQHEADVGSGALSAALCHGSIAVVFSAARSTGKEMEKTKALFYEGIAGSIRHFEGN